MHKIPQTNKGDILAYKAFIITMLNKASIIMISNKESIITMPNKAFITMDTNYNIIALGTLTYPLLRVLLFSFMYFSEI